MKNDYSFWINKWNKSNNFRVENNLIKPKSYLFSSFPKTNLYGFQDGNLRPVLIGDFFSRYQRMTGFNVLYPVGFDSLGLTSFMENKKRISQSTNVDGVKEPVKKDWGTGGCPFLFLADDESAEYDLEKLSRFFGKFKKKKKLKK